MYVDSTFLDCDTTGNHSSVIEQIIVCGIVGTVMTYIISFLDFYVTFVLCCISLPSITLHFDSTLICATHCHWSFLSETGS